MDYWKEIGERFPVRYSRAQKQAFAEWAVNECKAHGWQARVEENGLFRHRQIVVGRPDETPMLITAPYDTPARRLLPEPELPHNLPLYILVQLGTIALMFVPAFLAMWGLLALGAPARFALLGLAAVFLAEALLTVYGPANRHNRNDNDSGVAALMTLMASLEEEDRGKCAFLLTDNGFRGAQGARAWAKQHVQVQYTHLAVNLQRVGVGKELLCLSRSQARRVTGEGALEKTLAETEGLDASFLDSRSTVTRTDMRAFKCGVDLMTCRRMRVVGWYIPHVRTPRDTEADPENIAAVAGALKTWLRRLGTGKETQQKRHQTPQNG